MSLFDASAAAVVEGCQVIFGDLVLYTPTVGSPVSFRAVAGWHDPAITFGGMETQVRSPGVELTNVKFTDMPVAPEKGESLVILEGAHVGSYTIKDSFEDTEKLTRTLDVA